MFPAPLATCASSDLDDTIKIVRVDELLPNDKGYKLHVQSQVGN